MRSRVGQGGSCPEGEWHSSASCIPWLALCVLLLLDIIRRLKQGEQFKMMAQKIRVGGPEEAFVLPPPPLISWHWGFRKFRGGQGWDGTENWRGGAEDDHPVRSQATDGEQIERERSRQAVGVAERGLLLQLVWQGNTRCDGNWHSLTHTST